MYTAAEMCIKGWKIGVHKKQQKIHVYMKERQTRVYSYVAEENARGENFANEIWLYFNDVFRVKNNNNNNNSN